MASLKWPATLNTSARVAAAETKVSELVNQMLDLFALHEANRFITYTPLLSKQIPASHAAHAFNVFQRSSFLFEVLRVCALWESPEENRISIPTVVALIDEPKVLDALGKRIVAAWSGPPSASEMDPQIAAAWAERDREFGEEQRSKLMGWTLRAIHKARAVTLNDKLRSLRNFRDKNIAHSLTTSRAESRGTVFSTPKYGDERFLVTVSATVLRCLYLGISNTDFNFRNSRRIARRRATSLWTGCRFEILD